MKKQTWFPYYFRSLLTGKRMFSVVPDLVQLKMQHPERKLHPSAQDMLKKQIKERLRKRRIRYKLKKGWVSVINEHGNMSFRQVWH